MSQSGSYDLSAVIVPIQFLTGDIGGAVPAAAANIFLLGGNNITVTGTPAANTLTFDVTGTTQYALQVGDATGSLDSLAIGTAGQVLQSGGAGANPAWSTTTYPATSATGDVIYATAANTLGTLAFDATATRYLANTGGGATIPAWDQINLTNGVTGILPVGNGGIGIADPTDHSLLVGSGAAAMTALGAATNGQLVIGSTGADPVLAVPTNGNNISWTGGAGTLQADVTGCTQYALQVGSATGALASIAVGTATQVLQSGGAGVNPAWSTTTYPATSAIGDVIYASGANAYANLAFDATATRYLANTGGGATVPAWDQVNLTNGVTGTLPVASGGTGAVTLTDHGVLVGSGVGAITPLATGTATQVLQSGGAGADPLWSTTTYPATSATGDIIYASAANTLGTLAFDATATRYLANTGGGATIPAWDQVNLANGVSGATQYAVQVGSATGALSSLGVGATGTLLVGATGGSPAFGTSANGDFTFTTATAAATRTLGVSNTDATGASYSAAALELTTQSASTGDPFIHFVVNGGQDYALGTDNSDSDSLKINNNVNPSTGNTLWKMTSAGERTMPLQPAFLGYLASTVNNKTGAGTMYTLGTDALTEIFDQGSDFTAGGTFTAPVTGRYSLTGNICYAGIDATATYGQLRFVSSNRTYISAIISPGKAFSSSSNLSGCITVLADMDSGDTVTLTIEVLNMAGDTISIVGAATLYTYFCGHLVC